MLYIHTLFWIEAAAKLHIECLMLLIYFKANLQAFSIFLLFSISVCVCVCVLEVVTITSILILKVRI